MLIQLNKHIVESKNIAPALKKDPSSIIIPLLPGWRNGLRARLKIVWACPMWVQIPPRAPTWYSKIDMSKEDVLSAIEQFEPTFRAAGMLASQLRIEAHVVQKLKSGVPEVDIVTSADLEVQEFILKQLAESGLKECELVAEEDTPSKNLFSKESDYVITIDPIDGTLLYSQGKRAYSTIIGLHDKKQPLYTFLFHPELDCGLKIIGRQSIFFGKWPSRGTLHPKTISYSSAIQNPTESNPELCENMRKKGYQFVDKKTISKETGMTYQFLIGAIDGIYVENGSAVDCLIGLHYGLLNVYEINQNLDLAKPVIGSLGSEVYKGYYLVART